SAGDWSKELGLPTLAHTDNIAALTAWANDTSYDNIFVGQLQTWLAPGDLVVAYSGSGNSPNVVNGIEYASNNGARTVGITGDYKSGAG
ncbi:MAG TPA: SIS domain-containing protein, partial [Candidatus Poseidoniales archaeon]|nr:SIS domain-containing protein [Candidatus Poseidoniales archaeon]